jgi:MFS family permease
MANPLYALLIAYVNDFLEVEQMPAAGGRLLFVNGVGAIFGPIVVGGMMQAIGPLGYFYFIGGLVTVLALYAAYRMTVRPAPTVEDTGSYAPVLPSASPVVVGLAQEVFADAASDDGDDAQGTLPPAA